MEDLITIREWAQRSKICPKTMYRLIRDREIPHYRNGQHGKIRLLWSDWMAYYDRYRIQCQGDKDVKALLSNLLARA